MAAPSASTSNTPRRAHIDGQQFHAANLPYGLSSYFTHPTIEFRPGFPWLFLGRWISSKEFPGAKLDLPDRTAALPYGMTGLFVLATVAGAWAYRHLPAARPPLVTLWLAALPVTLALSAAIATAERYTGDFVPLLVCAGAFGLAAPLWGRLATTALALATLWACLLTFALTLHYQCAIVWGVPADVTQNYSLLRTRVDGFFSDRPTPAP